MLDYFDASAIVYLFVRRAVLRPSVHSVVRSLSHATISLYWSPYYKKDEELMEKVQRRFTKMIVNMEGLSYEE